MSVKVYSYKNCSTCQKALKFLTAAGIEAQVIDITTTPPSKSELKTMLKQYDGELKKLFNTSGQVYREMGLSSKLGGLSETQAVELLAANGKLLKRPFLLTGKVASSQAGAVGYREEEWRQILS